MVTRTTLETSSIDRVAGRSRRAWPLALVVLALVATGCATGHAMAPAPMAAPATAALPPPTDRPPEAKPGEAWCRVWVPGEMGVIQETVCVKPPCKHTVTIPAKYGRRPKLVCVAEAQLGERDTPARWATKKRPVMVCPPREELRRVDCPPADLAPGEVQCECWTKVQHPAVWGEEDCPVCVSPERTCLEYKPAEYKVVQERFLLEPAHTEEVCEPAVFTTRCRQAPRCGGHWEWRRNVACEVPTETATAPPMPAPAPVRLKALQVEMQDRAESGAEAGQFSVGDIVRYDLVVANDEGSEGLDGLKVDFALPPELEFVKGGGYGVTVSGSGQQATSASFDVPVGQSVTISVECRVLSAPPSSLVQTKATVRDATGTELAEETESTTLKPKQ